tara:strand:+ start:136 stop:822 length:687 start_codon:yes stop_codon:yes gene_type:complete
MSVEVSTYRLSLRGNEIGRNVIWTRTQNQTTNLESLLSLRGNFSQSTITQQSSCHASRFFSYRFSETTEARGEKRLYEVVFDQPSGLVTARRGKKDEASIPYLVPYRDPLSVLFEIRNWHNPDGCSKKIPLLGKEVAIVPKGTTQVQTSSGKKTAWAYSLYPGGSHVYVDTEEPHHILHLTQRLAGSNIESSLSKIEEITHMPGGQFSGTGNARKKKQRRRRRRKPRK